MRVPQLLRLVRPGLAPTAAADVLAAAIFVGGARVLPLAGGVTAGVLLYSGGMALNDIVDRERDRTLHPHRPLVAHPSLLGAARLLVVGLYLAGLAIAWVAGALGPALGVAAASLAYDLGGKHRFPWDAVLLGGARASNLGIGFVLAGAHLSPDVITYLAAYFLYIGGVTIASRAEDQEPSATRRLTLLLSFVPVLLALGAIVSLSIGWRGLVFVGPVVLLGFLLARAIVTGTREAAMRYVFRALLSIYVVHGCCLWGAGKPLALLPVFLCAAATFFLLGLMAQPAAATGAGPPPDRAGTPRSTSEPPPSPGPDTSA